MRELIPVFSTHPRPFPQRGKGEVDVLNRWKKLQPVYLVFNLNGIFYGKEVELLRFSP